VRPPPVLFGAGDARCHRDRAERGGAGAGGGGRVSQGVRTIGGVAIRVEWVGYGRAAAEALRAEIARAKGDEALAPVTVVVPSNHVGVAARRLLASGTLGPTCGRGIGLVGVAVVTP